MRTERKGLNVRRRRPWPPLQAEKVEETGLITGINGGQRLLWFPDLINTSENKERLQGAAAGGHACKLRNFILVLQRHLSHEHKRSFCISLHKHLPVQLTGQTLPTEADKYRSLIIKLQRCAALHRSASQQPRFWYDWKSHLDSLCYMELLWFYNIWDVKDSSPEEKKNPKNYIINLFFFFLSATTQPIRAKRAS